MSELQNNAPSKQDRKDEFDPRLEGLLEHLQRLLPHPEQVPAFREAMTTEPGADVRVNSLLPVAATIGGRLASISTAIPWCAQAMRLPPELADIVSHSLEFRLGALYMQAKATTLAVQALDPQPGELVLDIAAAPGGKATQIATAMVNTGLLVANEPRHRRLAALVGNLERSGAHNTLVTSVMGAELARSFHNVFDRVLLDAPCSGDGIVCKDRHMLSFWSPEDAIKKSVQQIGLLRASFHMLRRGGRLVYSTCSLSTEENEDVLLGLQRRFGDLVRIDSFPLLTDGELAADVAVKYPASFIGAARIWPHLHATEGAFLAVITKMGETEWDTVYEDAGPLLRQQPECVDREGWATRIASRWDLSLQLPEGSELIAEGRQLHLRRTGAAAFGEHPWYVRSGMRVATLHKDHYFLSQQAVALWGDQVQQRRLDIDWQQLQILFSGQACEAHSPQLTGEVICFFDDMPICRSVVSSDGTSIEGCIPKVARTPRLTRLLS